MKIVSKALALTCALMLAACGGGGTDSAENLSTALATSDGRARALSENGNTAHPAIGISPSGIHFSIPFWTIICRNLENIPASKKSDICSSTSFLGGAAGRNGLHIAALGPLSGATVTVSPINEKLNVIARTTTNSGGLFSVVIDPTFAERLLLVTVTGGVDTDADDDGTPDAVPTPNAGSLQLLVKGRLLAERSVSVNVLSDAIARRLEVPSTYLPQERIESAMEQLAYQLLDGDIDGDRLISYGDVLSFNPTSATQRSKLSFNYIKAVLGEQVATGGTLASKYHRASEKLAAGLEEAFWSRLDISLPTQEQAKQFSIVVRAGAGGSVTGPGFDIGAGNREATRILSQTDGGFLLQAIPEEGFVFKRWVGCESPVGLDSCNVSGPTENKIIAAQFALTENKLASGLAGELSLADPANGTIGVVFEGPDEIVVTTRADSPFIVKLGALSMNAVLHTGIVSRPQVKVTEILARGFIGGFRFYQARFKFEKINLFDMYDQASFQEPDRSITLDDLKAVRYADEVPADKRTVILPTTHAGREFAPGPTPTAQEGGGSCEAGFESQFGYQLGRPDDVILFCIESGAEVLPKDEICNVDEWTAVIVDGRRYCEPASTNPFLTRKAPAQTERIRPHKRNGTKITRGSTLLAGTAAPRSYSAMSQRMAKAKSEGRLTAQRQASEVWLVGYGRAFDLGDGVFITNNPKKPGLLMLEVDEKPVAVPQHRRFAVFEALCRRDIQSPECAGMGRIQRSAFNLLPPGFEVDLTTPQIPALVVRVAVQVEVDFKSAGAITWVTPVRIEVNTSGSLKLTPEIGLSLIYQGGIGGELKKTGERFFKSDQSSNNAIDLYKKLISFDVAKKTPIGVIFQAELEFGAGVELFGEVKLENKLTMPTAILWDGFMAAGWGCRRSWLRDCTTDTVFDLKVVPAIHARFDLKGSASVVVEPYLQVALKNGVTGVGESLSTFAVRGFMQGELILETPLLSISNIAADVAARNGRNVCVDGNLKLLGNIYAGGRATYEYSTENSLLKKFWSINRKVQLVEYKKKLYSWGWDEPREDKPLLPKSPGTVDLSNQPPEVAPCAGAVDAATLPDETTFRAGHFGLDANAWRTTKTRRIKMQEDGNLVVYEYDTSKSQEDDRIGRARWASNTNSGLNYRLVFQSDGNLVIYNLREQALWASGTSNNPGATLKLQSDGNLVIYSADNRPLWASGTN